MMQRNTMFTQIQRDVLKDWDILLVEDEADSRDVAERILKFYGAKVHSATNGQSALEMLTVQSLRPKFIICDLSMPIMDGCAFVARLKRDRPTLDIPIIALTAHAMLGDREKAIAAGLHQHLTKTLSFQAIINQLLLLLAGIP